MPSMRKASDSMHWLNKLFGRDNNTSLNSTRELHSTSSASVQALTPFRRADDVPLYANRAGFLLVAEASVSEVNKCLNANDISDLVVGETAFRPNIFVTETKNPYAEDSWMYVRIGNCLFRNTGPCTRCKTITIDPKTGKFHSHGEPLKTLKQIRSSPNPEERKVYGDAPFFGINLGVDICGTIKVGDKVFVGVPSPKNHSWISENILSKIGEIGVFFGFSVVCAMFAQKMYERSQLIIFS
jgi:uncharacterized protein YcbX